MMDIVMPERKGEPMRLIDADALIALVQDSTILSDGFKQVFCALVNGEPTIELRCEECEAFNKARLLIPQPERKKGKWIAHPDDFDEWYCCSVCHKWLTMFDGTYNFCPNCGARMEADND